MDTPEPLPIRWVIRQKQKEEERDHGHVEMLLDHSEADKVPSLPNNTAICRWLFTNS